MSSSSAPLSTPALAGDLVALMDALGHERFAVVGHDTGFAISHALAADHPDRVARPRRTRSGRMLPPFAR
jgi:pimeloyl-ACP methyl ester carboxylesterase